VRVAAALRVRAALHTGGGRGSQQKLTGSRLARRAIFSPGFLITNLNNVM